MQITPAQALQAFGQIAPEKLLDFATKDGPLTTDEITAVLPTGMSTYPGLADDLARRFAHINEVYRELQPAQKIEAAKKELFLENLMYGLFPGQEPSELEAALNGLKDFITDDLKSQIVSQYASEAVIEYLSDGDGRALTVFLNDITNFREYIERLNANPYDFEAAKLVGSIIFNTPYFPKAAKAALSSKVEFLYCAAPVLLDVLEHTDKYTNPQPEPSHQPVSPPPQSDSKTPLIGALATALVAAVRFIFSGQKKTDFFSSLGMLQVGAHAGGAIRSMNKVSKALDNGVSSSETIANKRSLIQSAIGLVISGISYYMSPNKATGAVMPLFTGVAAGFLGWMSENVRSLTGISNE